MKLRSLQITLVLTLTIILSMSMGTRFAQAYHMETFYPITGDLLYDGYFFADSYFRWDQVATGQTTFPGYEHDLIIDTDYISMCTSFTDLPWGYDDCPTAGKFEPNSDEWAFSFGSSRLHSIEDYQYYMGAWRFGGGSEMQGTFRLKGQETKWIPGCPWPDYVWCRDGQETWPTSMAAGTFYLVNPPQYWQWQWSD